MQLSKWELRTESIINRLDSIIEVAKNHEIDADSQLDGYNYLVKDVENFARELKKNKVEEDNMIQEYRNQIDYDLLRFDKFISNNYGEKTNADK